MLRGTFSPLVRLQIQSCQPHFHVTPRPLTWGVRWGLTGGDRGESFYTCHCLNNVLSPSPLAQPFNCPSGEAVLGVTLNYLEPGKQGKLLSHSAPIGHKRIYVEAGNRDNSVLALEAQRQETTAKGKLSPLLVPPSGGRRQEKVTLAGAGGRGGAGMERGVLVTLRKALPALPPPAPAPAPGFSCLSPNTPWYLGSRLQGQHEIFDHFGFRHCDSAHHKQDQERVVAGMRPAHLQNKHHQRQRDLSAERCAAGCHVLGPRAATPHSAELNSP